MSFSVFIKRIRTISLTSSRIIHEIDARVAATAFIKKEKLATGDLKFFKRGLDLGLDMVFIGSGKAKAKALAYVIKPVKIPIP